MSVVKLDYGKGTIEAAVPEHCRITVLNLKRTGVVADPFRAVKKGLDFPIGTEKFAGLCRKVKTACVVVSDRTRSVPNKLLLPPLLETLNKFSVSTEIVVACGLHAPGDSKDLAELLGEEILEEYRVINHDPGDEKGLTCLGDTGSGIPVYINRIYCDAELKILTGLIEPHFMAGFSGGRKSICPGIAGIETIRYFHSPEVLESSRAKAGVLEGNPCNKIAQEVAERAGCDFIVNVTLTAEKEISGIFCGEPKAAFAEGAKFCEEQASAYVAGPADMVISSNGGYPLDRDFYQTVKGIAGAAEIVRPGGTIIVASECRNGIGGEEFQRQLFNLRDVDEFIETISRPGYFCVDQWQIEKMIAALRKARIKLYSENLTDAEIKKCRCEPVRDLNREIAGTIKDYGREATAAVIPNGPYVMAKCKSRGTYPTGH